MRTTITHILKRALPALLCGALLLGTGGCSTMRNYLGMQQENELPDPERLNLEQVARVICETSSRRLLVAARDDAEQLKITAVDAQSLHSYWDGLFNGGAYPSAVRIMPGTHVLQVQYQDAVFYGDGELKLDAEAGKTYKVRQKVLGLSVQFWLEDSDGRQVGTAVSKVLHGVDRG
jgi:hypothetical protein